MLREIFIRKFLAQKFSELQGVYNLVVQAHEHAAKLSNQIEQSGQKERALEVSNEIGIIRNQIVNICKESYKRIPKRITENEA